MFLETLLAHCLLNYRWIFVCVFLLPCTVVYDMLIFLKSAFGRLTKQELNEVHLDKVKFLQQQVNNWNKSDQSVPMCTGRPGWKTMTLREPKYKASMYNIHINMDSIIDIDFDNQVMKVEPLVTMGQISSKLNPKKWTVPIVAELDDLTVGSLSSKHHNNYKKLLDNFWKEIKQHEHGEIVSNIEKKIAWYQKEFPM